MSQCKEFALVGTQNIAVLASGRHIGGSILEVPLAIRLLSKSYTDGGAPPTHSLEI